MASEAPAVKQPMQRNRGLNVKTGYHAVYESNYFEAINLAKNNGFEFVQFDLGVPTFFLDNLTDNDLNEIKKFSKDNGIELSFHAPGDNVSLFCDYPKIRQGNIDQFLSIIDKANQLDARHITFHTGQYPSFKKSNCLIDDFSLQFADYYMNVLCKNIIELLNCSQTTLICFENSGFNSLIMKVLGDLIKDKRNLYLTLDTAKSYTKNFVLDQDIFEFMIRYSERVREIHIHDFNKEYGGHQIVGDGLVDFNLFKDFLFKNDVFMNFEVRPMQAAKISKQKLIEMFDTNLR
ncbi:MAG: sugar phosphate isomerase/epimerase family protein [Armatimonadota bacterium]